MFSRRQSEDLNTAMIGNKFRKKSTDYALKLNENLPLEVQVQKLTQSLREMDEKILQMCKETKSTGEKYRLEIEMLQRKVEKVEQAVTFQENLTTFQGIIKDLGHMCNYYKSNNLQFREQLEDCNKTWIHEIKELRKTVNDIKTVVTNDGVGGTSLDQSGNYCTKNDVIDAAQTNQLGRRSLPVINVQDSSGIAEEQLKEESH